MLLPHGAVIALVDGKNFDLYRNAGNEAQPDLTALPSPQLDASNHSGGSHRSSTGNHADRLVSEDAHAIAAAEWLNAQVLGHKITDLVVIAAPRTLGEMRQHYHKQTANALRGEIAKDLTGRQPSQLLEALRAKG